MSRCASVFTHPELALCLPDADADVVPVGANERTHGAHAHFTLATVDPVYFLVLLTLPEGDVLYWRHQSVALEDWGFQVGAQMLLAHGGPTHQTSVYCWLTPGFRAVVARDGGAGLVLWSEEDGDVDWGS